MVKVLTVFCLSVFSGYSSVGFDLTVQKPFDAVGNWPILTMSFVKTSVKPPLYFSSGITMRPGTSVERQSTLENPGYREKTYCFYGAFAGTHVALSPAFRPGLLAGFSFKREAKISPVDSNRGVEYSSFFLNPYVGFTVHFMVLSFVVTNEGVGGGVNLSFGR